MLEVESLTVKYGPFLALVPLIVAFVGLAIVAGVTGWTGIARFVRAEFLKQRDLDYVSAAKALGLPLRNILFKHMLPNGLTPVIVSFTLAMSCLSVNGLARKFGRSSSGRLFSKASSA